MALADQKTKIKINKTNPRGRHTKSPVTIVKSKISGNKTNPAAAGEGTPSKKFIFHDSLSSIVVKLNLARRRAQHTV